MKLNSITLKDFRNHELTETNLAPLTIVKGGNAAGKSSIRYALEIALTGRCEATDRGGKGAADLVRVGAKKGAVAIFVDGLGEIKRTISPSGSSLQVADWSGSIKFQQESLYQKLGADADLISAVVNVSDFITLPPREQAELLFRVLAPRLVADDVLAGLDEVQREVLADVAGSLADLSPERCEAVHKQLYDARREAKKELEQARGLLAGLEDFAESGSHDPALLPEMRRQLAELEERKAALEAEVAAARAAEERRRRERFLARQIQADLAELEERLEGLEAPADAPAEREELEELNGRLAAARAESDRLVAEIRALDAAQAALKKAKGKCPLSELITCPLKGSELNRLVKDLEVKRTGLVAGHEEAQKEASGLLARINEINKRLAAVEEANRLQAETAEAREELETIEADLAELEERAGAAETGYTVSEIQDLAGRIHRGHTLIAETELAERNRLTRAEAEAAVSRLETRVDALESLVRLFGPGPEGLRARAIKGAVSEVEIRVNTSLGQIAPGYVAGIRVEPEFHVVIAREGSIVELRQLSTSERMRVGIAFAEALAYLSGLRLLVIDDAEILDEANRALLSGYLLGLLEDYDTIILLSTSSQPKDPGLPGVATYWVEGGRVERVGGDNIEM